MTNNKAAPTHEDAANFKLTGEIRRRETPMPQVIPTSTSLERNEHIARQLQQATHVSKT